MNGHLEELMHELFWKGERPSTPPDLARVIEQLRDEWRAGSFEEPAFSDCDGDSEPEKAEGEATV